MPQIELSYVAVIVAAGIRLIIVWAWYLPRVFGRVPGDATHSSGGVRKLVATLGAVVLTALALALVVGYAEAQTIGEGILTGLIVWFGFALTTTVLGDTLAHRPLRATAIALGEQLVSYVIMGAVLATWPVT